MNKLTLYNVKLHGITFLLIFLFSITSYSMSCIEFFNAKGKSRISKKVTSYSYEKVKQEGLFFKTPTVLTSIRSELDKAAFRKMAKQEFDKRGFLGTEKVEYIAEIIDGRVFNHKKYL